jgi:hypothetical protein
MDDWFVGGTQNGLRRLDAKADMPLTVSLATPSLGWPPHRNDCRCRCTRGADEFLSTQLRPELLQVACDMGGHPLVLRMQPGHDHSDYFIASFIGEHIAHHAAALRRGIAAGR